MKATFPNFVLFFGDKEVTNSMDQVLQAIRELQGQMTRFEDNMNERMTKLDKRMDKLEDNQQDTQDNITILVKENWEHKKEHHRVKRRVGMEQTSNFSTPTLPSLISTASSCIPIVKVSCIPFYSPNQRRIHMLNRNNLLSSHQ
jgi:Sec-independent protein translocase protein TatA